MILGHERQITYLNQVLEKNKLAHAYLFYGPSGIGKATVARALAKALYCNKGKGRVDKVCDSCKECVSIDSYQHPQVLILDQEHTLVSKKEKRKEIPIEDIRELKRSFSFLPQGDSWRVAIIDEAEIMSQEAHDAFLKLLEEPGIRTLFILVTSSPELMPATIVSRAVPLRFSLVPKSLMAEKFDVLGREKKSKKEILALAQGRPGLLFSLLDNDQKFFDAEKSLLKGVISLLREKDLKQLFLLSEEAAADNKISQRAVEYLLRIFRKEMLGAAGRGDWAGPMKKIKRIAELNFMRQMSNVNPRLALDIIFLTAIE